MTRGPAEPAVPSLVCRSFRVPLADPAGPAVSMVVGGSQGPDGRNPCCCGVRRRPDAWPLDPRTPGAVAGQRAAPCSAARERRRSGPRFFARARAWVVTLASTGHGPRCRKIDSRTSVSRLSAAAVPTATWPRVARDSRRAGQMPARGPAGQATIASEEMTAMTIKCRRWLAGPRLLCLGAACAVPVLYAVLVRPRLLTGGRHPR
jgi:hypothetical protein